MPSGLIALLDDIAGITKLAAASLDDLGAAAGKAGTKAMGVVVDDAAVTPRYVTGLTPDRELPIIAKIAVGSLRNKLLILLPAALLLSAFAPWAIAPLLMLGGAYLCFEGAEKAIEAVRGEAHAEVEEQPLDAIQLEQSKVSGAVRTDLILSAEIMAIALASVSHSPLVTQAIVLALVGTGITIAVYSVVGLIVKMDDIGLHLARRRVGAVRAIGRALVIGMPLLMRMLSVIGTAAMIWVGGGILIHGMEVLGFGAPAGAVHHAAEKLAHGSGVIQAVLAWLITAAASGLFGLMLGAVIAVAIHKLRR
jgi:predicted DNA repair protein MutK